MPTIIAEIHDHESIDLQDKQGRSLTKHKESLQKEPPVNIKGEDNSEIFITEQIELKEENETTIL